MRSTLPHRYEPRLHHDAYKKRTPPAPGKGLGRWMTVRPAVSSGHRLRQAVARHWSNDEFLSHAGVDGFVMIIFLNFALDQCCFAAIHGLVILLPTYYLSHGLEAERNEAEERLPRASFSLTTVANLRCRMERSAVEKKPLFPQCTNHSSWRFLVVVASAWLFTLRALSRLSMTYFDFVRLRHWYVTSRLSPWAPSKDAQQALTVLVENIPKNLRSTRALKRKFEKLCGPNSVHSVRVMAGAGLDKLASLYKRREQAIESLVDARSRHAKAIASETLVRSSTDASASARSLCAPALFRKLLHKSRATILLWSTAAGFKRHKIHGVSAASPGRSSNCLPVPDPAHEVPSHVMTEGREYAGPDTIRFTEPVEPHAGIFASTGDDLESARRARCSSVALTEAAAIRAYVNSRVSLTSRSPRASNVASHEKARDLCAESVVDLAGVILSQHANAEDDAANEERSGVVAPPSHLHPKHLHIPGAPITSACLGFFRGVSSKLDGHFVNSILFYEKLVVELDEEIVAQHVATVSVDEDAVSLSSPASPPSSPSSRVLVSKDDDEGSEHWTWRGCFWMLGVESRRCGDDDDDDEIIDTTLTTDSLDDTELTRMRDSIGFHVPLTRWVHRRRRNHRKHSMAILATQPLRVSIPMLSRRWGLWAKRLLLERAPACLKDVRRAIRKSVTQFVLCGYGDIDASDINRHSSVKRLGIQPSSTAFVTFTRPTARLSVTSSLLAAAPFAMVAREAPEARDVIWENAYVSQEEILQRAWVVNLGIFALLLFWATVVSACSSSEKLVHYVPSFSDSLIANTISSLFPIVLLLTIINLLPHVFQAISRFYERHKSFSSVDLAVVERFFRFQFVHVYVSILSNALLTDVKRAWRNPYSFIKSIGSEMPQAATFFAKLLIFQCAASPLWVLRVWSLISSGYKTWTIQPPELPGILYAWAFPKVIMTFTIFSTFWVFAPLISCIAAVYFLLISFFFRYLILYVHMPVYESGGKFFYRVVERVLFGLGTSNTILFFWLLTHSLFGHALLVLPLPLIVVTFSRFAEGAYRYPSLRLALDEAVCHEKMHNFSKAFADKRFDAALYTQPALRRQRASMSVAHDVESLLACFDERPRAVDEGKSDGAKVPALSFAYQHEIRHVTKHAAWQTRRIDQLRLLSRRHFEESLIVSTSPVSSCPILSLNPGRVVRLVRQ